MEIDTEESRESFTPLDRRVIKVWIVANLIGYGVLALCCLPGVLIVGFKRPALFWWLVLGWLVLAAVCLWLSFWRPPRLYRAWGWRIDQKVLETRSGLLYRRRRLLPLNRLQHVDLQRGPFERLYGLSSLVLHTAGTHSANLTIPGLAAEEAVRLRDHLVEVGGDDAV